MGACKSSCNGEDSGKQDSALVGVSVVDSDRLQLSSDKAFEPGSPEAIKAAVDALNASVNANMSLNKLLPSSDNKGFEPGSPEAIQAAVDALNASVNVKNQDPLSDIPLCIISGCNRYTHDGNFGTRCCNECQKGTETEHSDVCEQMYQARQEENAKKLLDAAGSGNIVAAREILSRPVSRPNAEDLPRAAKIAVTGNSLEIVTLLLDQGVDKNSKSNDGETLLHTAVWKGLLDMAKLLVTRNADVEAQNTDGTTPLMAALEEGHEDVAKILLDHGPPCLKETLDKRLIEACQLCEAEPLGMLLRCGANPNAQAGDGDAALLIAADRNQAEIAKQILSARADVNTVGEEGCSALFIACVKGYVDFAQILLEAEADYKLKSKDGSTALTVVAKSGNLDLAKLLTGKGARLTAEQRQQFGKQLVTAVEKSKEQDVKCLLQCGVSAKVKKDSKTTLMMIAVEKGSQNLIKIFAKEGLTKADKEALGKKLSKACMPLDMEQAKFFLSVGASTETKNANGSTPLLTAAENGQLELSALLLEKGADKKASNRDGHSVLRIAIDHGHYEMAQQFKKKGMVLFSQEQGELNGKFLTEALAGNAAQAKILLDCGASVESKDVSSESAMHKAAGSGHMSVVKLLLEKKASLQPKGGEYGTTPLFYAARNKQMEVAKYLVEKGAGETDADPEGAAKYETLLAEAKKKGKTPAKAKGA